MRDRNGETLPFVFKSEAAAVATIGRKVAPGSTIYADEAASWDRLHDHFLTKRINHEEAYSTAEACTNGAESFFSRIRRSESASTIISPAHTYRPTLRRWPGARITAACRTVSSTL